MASATSAGVLQVYVIGQNPSVGAFAANHPGETVPGIDSLRSGAVTHVRIGYDLL